MLELLVFVISIFLILKKGKGAILYYPVIGTLFDIFKGYHLHNFVTENYRFVFLIILLFFFYLPYLPYSKAKPILFFILFLFVLLLFNPLTDSWKPSQITSTFNASSIVFMFLVGYNYINSFKKIKKLYNILILNSIIILVYFVCIQIFSFQLLTADSSYSDIFISHHFDYDIYTVSYTVLIMFFIREHLTTKREKLLNTFFIVANLILLIIFMKRWAIFSTFLGIFIFLFYTGNVAKKLKSLSFVIILAIATSIFFMDIIIEQFVNRGDKVSGLNELKNEGRTFDYLNMYHYITTNNSIREILVGGNLFESRDFGQKYLNEVRNIHPDLLALLYGTGFLGLFLYLYIYKWLFKKTGAVYDVAIKSYLNKDIYSVCKMFIIVLVFISIAGGALRVTTADSLAFLFIGGCIRILSLKKKLNKN